jgi:hypothetical protein
LAQQTLPMDELPAIDPVAPKSPRKTRDDRPLLSMKRDES